MKPAGMDAHLSRPFSIDHISKALGTAGPTAETSDEGKHAQAVKEFA